MGKKDSVYVPAIKPFMDNAVGSTERKRTEISKRRTIPISRTIRLFVSPSPKTRNYLAKKTTTSKAHHPHCSARSYRESNQDSSRSTSRQEQSH